MDADLKKTLKYVEPELRHLLEGRYDSDRKWTPGDLEQRPAAIGDGNQDATSFHRSLHGELPPIPIASLLSDRSPQR